MKKLSIFSFLGSAIAVVALSACTNSSSEDSSQIADQEVSVKKLDDYLYQVEYDDYNFDSIANVINESFAPPKAACSQVRKGNFIARNFDWYINQDATAILRVKGNSERFASVGVSGAYPLFKQVNGKLDTAENDLGQMMFYTVDGINEKGVYVGVNVAPTGETSMDKSKWEPYAWGVGAAYTNPKSEKHYNVMFLARYILDYASSVDDAIKKIDAIDWFEPYNFTSDGGTQSFHWIIADRTKNVVIEFIDNKLKYLLTDKVEEPSLATIMTNFSNGIMADSKQQKKDSLIQYLAAGLERYDILFDNYDKAETSFNGMENLIKKVWYSHVFTDSVQSENFLFTEYAGAQKANGDEFYLAEELYKNKDLANDSAFASIVDNNHNRFADKSNWHTPDTKLWYTTHSIVYNLETKSFEIILHEGYDGMKDWLKVEF
ncbi:carcinine hydrolase/isopenicillin-N N-acyltransferase family protein [Fibrobacter sp.]|uniref:carcinine hydrolase/isopenicillin-N N-acyltransferase family protein n=1 Tax=Fibrobacter sp. TaxID=35828 RepID=UPI00388ECC6F